MDAQFNFQEAIDAISSVGQMVSNQSIVSQIESKQSIVTSIIAFMTAYSLIMFLIGILLIVALWYLFKKAEKPGWAALLPIYNLVVLFRIVKLNAWLLLLILVPPAVPILFIIALFRLAKVFGKSIGFGVGLILLYPIFLPILAFDSSKYEPDKVEAVD